MLLSALLYLAWIQQQQKTTSTASGTPAINNAKTTSKSSPQAKLEASTDTIILNLDLPNSPAESQTLWPTSKPARYFKDQKLFEIEASSTELKLTPNIKHFDLKQRQLEIDGAQLELDIEFD